MKRLIHQALKAWKNHSQRKPLILLGILNGNPILPGRTLLIFDEIQECSAALTSLKYFCEEMPELHVACAGSLRGVAVAGPGSFPVGKVDFLTLRPQVFREFLAAGDGVRATGQRWIFFFKRKGRSCQSRSSTAPAFGQKALWSIAAPMLHPSRSVSRHATFPLKVAFSTCPSSWQGISQHC